jgi:hypothetical protein
MGTVVHCLCTIAATGLASTILAGRGPSQQTLAAVWPEVAAQAVSRNHAGFCAIQNIRNIMAHNNLRRIFPARWGECADSAALFCAIALGPAARRYFGEFTWLNRIEQRRKQTLQIGVERRCGEERRVA